MGIGRLVTHTLVLAVALTLASYATLDTRLPADLGLPLAAVSPEGFAIGQGGTAGAVALERSGAIVNPANVPQQPVPPHAALVYVVRAGDSLQSLADSRGVSPESIRWSNYPALKSLGSDVRAGQVIVIPPVSGVAVSTRTGDTPRSLAAAYHASVQDLLAFNYIRSGADAPLPPATSMVIPGGRGPDLSPAPSTGAGPGPAGFLGARFTVTALPGVAPGGGGNPFPYGQCTWWVYHLRPVPWSGNAIAWLGQAQRSGWLTGRTPRPGAIMVTAESFYGHVAYVQSVAGDGSWTVSEMNYLGLGRVDQRTIQPAFGPLLGFIYGPP